MSYLVCDKCGGYYELQPGESPDDFTDKCECGGHLRYVQNLNDDENLQKVCPKCGSLIEDNNETCPTCGFELKMSSLTEKQIIFGVLWDVFSISILMVGAIFIVYAIGIVIIPAFLNPNLTSDFYTDIWIIVMISLLAIVLVGGTIIRLEIARERYLKFYKKINWSRGAIIISFLFTMVIGVFGGRYLPDNVSIIGPIIGGFIAGCIVGKSYINGLVQGGLPAGIAGFIGFPLLVLFFGSKIIDWNNISMVLVIIMSYAILFFMIFFIVSSISGIIGAGIKKRISS
jgi:hypothetical protein